MLLFHGGLPRSGKSMEAVKKHLVPALKKGRKVYARIDGLNYDQLAALAGITREKCDELLHHIEEKDVPEFHLQKYDAGALFIIDEVQNYWPDGRKPLSPELTKFVAEHGHEGHDILLMGQEFKDMHKLWKNRVSQRVMFNKLDMLGSGKKYVWKLEKATEPQKFKGVSSGTEEYDSAYFGSYKSFVPGAENNQLYDDKRASVWNSAFFKKVLPFAVVGLGFAVYYIYGIFNGGLEKGITKKEPATSHSVAARPAAGAATVAASVTAAVKQEDKDLIQDLTDRYRLRVTGIIKSASKTSALFEWYDEGSRVKERLSMVAVARLGYAVQLDPDMESATLSKGGRRYVATQFPLESSGTVSQDRQRLIAGESAVPQAVPPVSSL